MRVLVEAVANVLTRHKKFDLVDLIFVEETLLLKLLNLL